MAISADYAELHCVSNFTFLRGASHPEELVAQAAQLGYRALAITDECSVAGVVRAHTAAKQAGIDLIVGSELRLTKTAITQGAGNVRRFMRPGDEAVADLRLVLLACHRAGYAQLCELITAGRRAAPKGEYLLTRRDLEAGLPGCLALWLPGAVPDRAGLQWLCDVFGSARVWVAVELFAGAGDRARCEALRALAAQVGVRAVACGDVHMHVRGRRALQDTVTAIRLRTTVAGAVASLYPNGERHLRPRERLARIYPRPLLDETLAIAAQCDFSLDELRYEYPEELVPPGETPASHLRKLTGRGMQRRWPGRISDKVRRMIEHELELIADLEYEQFFLTVHEIVEFARSRGILCQGRGSAANSAVCFALGITEVDPSRMAMLFERFISRERNEPPDIDVDFEHERREEVIQHIYAKYGRERAALAATVICYRARSAARDVAKALGLDALQVERLTRALDMWQGEISDERIREGGFDPANPTIARIAVLARELMGFPRHLSQHVGGFVISRGPLSSLVPVENAAMEDRTVIQWDKDDLDALGLLKVDVLGLGMLSAIRRSFELIRDFDGRQFTLANVPAEDPRVYDMICTGDTMGVFQIESRAQMAMLPRLRPRSYYDLVIEVAIIRPGPIQGDMVHPYLRRRNGEEPVTYPSEDVREVLSRTLGVPIFQEQVMEIAMVAAGFTPGEADQLRRAMAAWRKRGGLGPFEDKLKDGMRERGYSEQFAEQIFNQVKGFGEYGFPESHAASFALLVYVSAWLKCHEPAAFTCALINSQPMGFYAPSQLVQDVQRHGVTVRAADVLYSCFDCTLERDDDGAAVLRLGLRIVKGLSEDEAARIVAARGARVFRDVQDLTERARLDRHALGVLAAAGALASLSGNRHLARWDVAGVEEPMPLLPTIEIREATPMLRRPTAGEDVIADYQATGLTLGPHPMALLREQLDFATPAAELWDLPDGVPVYTAGIVITRQRPGTAKGVMFVTLEDETGCVNLIVWPKIAERQRRITLGARLLGVRGELQRQGDVLHVVAQVLHDHSELLGALPSCSRDFH